MPLILSGSPLALPAVLFGVYCTVRHGREHRHRLSHFLFVPGTAMFGALRRTKPLALYVASIHSRWQISTAEAMLLASVPTTELSVTAKPLSGCRILSIKPCEASQNSARPLMSPRTLAIVPIDSATVSGHCFAAPGWSIAVTM